MDLVKVEDDNAAPSPPEVAKASPTPPDKSASTTPDVHKSLLPANYAEMVQAMLVKVLA